MHDPQFNDMFKYQQVEYADERPTQPSGDIRGDFAKALKAEESKGTLSQAPQINETGKISGEGTSLAEDEIASKIASGEYTKVGSNVYHISKKEFGQLKKIHASGKLGKSLSLHSLAARPTVARDAISKFSESLSEGWKPGDKVKMAMGVRQSGTVVPRSEYQGPGHPSTEEGDYHSGVNTKSYVAVKWSDGKIGIRAPQHLQAQEESKRTISEAPQIIDTALTRRAARNAVEDGVEYVVLRTPKGALMTSRLDAAPPDYEPVYLFTPTGGTLIFPLSPGIKVSEIDNYKSMPTEEPGWLQ